MKKSIQILVASVTVIVASHVSAKSFNTQNIQNILINSGATVLASSMVETLLLNQTLSQSGQELNPNDKHLMTKMLQAATKRAKIKLEQKIKECYTTNANKKVCSHIDNVQEIYFNTNAQATEKQLGNKLGVRYDLHPLTIKWNQSHTNELNQFKNSVSLVQQNLIQRVESQDKNLIQYMAKENIKISEKMIKADSKLRNDKIALMQLEILKKSIE